MSNSTAQVLMKKGKRGAAAYIHADCASGSPQHLGPLLDVLLNPSKAIDEWETIDWCRWLIAGGRTPDEFAAVVRSYDKHDKCGLVWIPRVVAYRCRTCGISPCMSICRDCFHRGDHSTHDFNMFLSQAGGACDCGDNSVMKEDGFCSNHGNKCPRPGTAPADLMCVAEAMVPRLILRLLQHFRENSWGTANTSDSYRIAVHDCEGYVQMLMDLNNMGDLMRSAMTKALINPQMYRNLVLPPFPATEYGWYLAESRNMYERALDGFPAPDPPDEYRSLAALAPRLSHNTLLEEFIFWTFKYEFPQNVVCLLLNMLPDQDYKEHLTRTFVMHYARIPLVLESAADPDTLSNRVVHMSVQLFSNEALALRCVQQLHLLHVMVLSLRIMMGKILIQNTLHDPSKNFHYVIDCTRRVMKEHCYWPLVSDFNNVLSHKSVALLFLQDDALLDMWFEFLSMLQGMNVNVRETGGHIEFEPSSYYAAFSCELEAAAYPMWSVLGHVRGAGLAARPARAALAALQDWLDAVHLPRAPTASDRDRASFHLPLHRYLSAFYCAGVRGGAAPRLPAPDLLALTATHPLRVQALFYEILAGKWVRNGLQIKGQAMTYIQANFCNSMVDMDIYWLQVCAAHLPPDQFIDMCIDTFGVREWLSMAPMSAAAAAEQDAMVEGLLTFLAILVSSRTNLGNDELTQSRLEVSTLLAAGDKTHSQLLELMPERSGNAHTRNFETVLKELSTYRPPPKGSENLEQGLFVPKPLVWETYYDPLHVLRRAVHRRDFHASMERYSAYIKEKQKCAASSSKSSSGAGGAGAGGGAGPGAGAGGASALWPPLRPPPPPPPHAPDPRLLTNSRVLHGALLAVLARGALARSGAGGSVGGGAGPGGAGPGGAGGAEAGEGGRAPPDHVLALAVLLLRTATALHDTESWSSCVARCSAGEGVGGAGAEGGALRGRPLLAAFPSGSVVENARLHVHSVPAPAPAPSPDLAAQPHTNSSTEWESAPPSPPAPGAALAVPHDSLPPPALQSQVARRGSETDEQSDGGDTTYIRELTESESSPLALAPLALPNSNTVLMEMEPDLTLAQSELSLTQSELTLTQGELALPQPDLTLALPAPHTPTYEMSEAEWGLSIMDRASEQDQDELSDDNQMQVAEVVDERTIPVNESIISLLLKLHSQLEGKVDSFALEDVPDTENMDGPYYIGCLLRELAGKEPRCADVINSLRHQLWGRQRQRQAELEAKERREKEERSRRARERQAAIMAEMARQQRQFLSSLGGAAESPPPSPGARSPRPPRPAPEPDAALRPREYHCVICSSSDTPGHSDPLGPVVLLQSTSVPGHRRRAGSERAALPLSEAERTRLQADNERTAAALAYRAAQDLQQTFSQESCVTACGGGWALHAGVAAATCGHHLHLRCLLAYLRSLQATPHVERGEFLCPVCRQLANSVLPLAPECEVPTQLADPGLTLGELAAQLQALLDRAPDPPPETTPLSEAMGKSMEDMISTAGRGVRARHGSSPAALLAFVASLARTNLECELIQRGGDLLTHNHRYKPRNDCIVPLLEVIGVHARALRAAGGAATVSAYWRALAAGGGAGGGGAGAAGGGAGEEGGCSSVVPTCRQAAAVPLLLADPLSLFTHLILLAPQRPPHLDPSHFNCIVRVLYTLTYYQIVCQLLANTSAAGRAALAGDSANTGEGLRGAARTVLTALHDMQLWPDDDGVAPGPIADPENEVRELLLPFLRVVAVARAHILQQPLPEILRPEDEFANLLYYLELVPETPGVPVLSCAGLRSEVRPRAWVRQLATAAADSQLAVRRIVSSLHSAWRGPHLLRLPRSYERLFSHYHERVCGVCGAVPKEAAVCLLCGALLCLKQACCRRMQVCEAVQHSIECGGGTGIFLVVTSTYIIVIRGRRACLWGSLYLDDYDEEDRDLKRGKPLYLSQDRADLLEAQWLAHRFDHTKRTWVWHRDSL